MLKKVEINNFKSWRRLALDLAPITGLFGANSSGKSSLLQFLLTLKQTKETVDRSLALDFGNAKSYINLGTYHDVVFNHNVDTSINWNLKWLLPENLEITDPMASRKVVLFEGKEMELSSSVSVRNKQLVTDCLAYQFSKQSFALRRKEKRPSAFSLSSDGEKTDYHFVRKQGRVWDIPGPVKSYAFPDQAKTYYQNSDLLSDLEFSYEQLVDSIYYLGPLRDYPKREYTWSGARPMDVGSRGERVVDAILAAKAGNETRNLGPRKRYMDFEIFIAHWLKALGLISDFTVQEIAKNSNLYKVEVRKEKKSAPVLITDVGFGVSQFLPVLVLLYYVPEGSIVLLEQPEIHLHPAGQSGLADVIVNAVQTRNIQVVVESHSEHLLRRLQLRVADESVSAEDMAIYFCETQGGESKLQDLKLNLFGEIENWPPNFFGDELGEVAAIHKAALKRRIASQS